MPSPLLHAVSVSLFAAVVTALGSSLLRRNVALAFLCYLMNVITTISVFNYHRAILWGSIFLGRRIYQKGVGQYEFKFSNYSIYGDMNSEYKVGKYLRKNMSKPLREKKKEIVKIQEELGIDVLVHGESEKTCSFGGQWTKKEGSKQGAMLD